MASKASATRTTARTDLPQTALVEPAHAPYVPNKPSRSGSMVFSATVALAVFCFTLATCRFGLGLLNVWTIVLGLVLGGLASMAMHIAMEWERIVIFRFGAFNRVAGPGLVFMAPVVEQAACRVDMRTIATPFGAEKTLTSDLVPLDVDAVLFWMVWDAKKACVEVEDYCSAVLYVAQATLRDAIGRASVAEVALNREQLDKELKEVIERETAPWGIAVLNVKVRDIVIPSELQDAMSLEAQAEREKNARLVLAEAEEEIAEMVSAAGEAYGSPEAALKIRSMHLLYESVKKSSGTVIAVPSALADGLGSGCDTEGRDAAKALANAMRLAGQ